MQSLWTGQPPGRKAQEHWPWPESWGALCSWHPSPRACSYRPYWAKLGKRSCTPRALNSGPPHTCRCQDYSPTDIPAPQNASPSWQRLSHRVPAELIKDSWASPLTLIQWSVACPRICISNKLPSGALLRVGEWLLYKGLTSEYLVWSPVRLMQPYWVQACSLPWGSELPNYASGLAAPTQALPEWLQWRPQCITDLWTRVSVHPPCLLTNGQTGGRHSVYHNNILITQLLIKMTYCDDKFI